MSAKRGNLPSNRGPRLSLWRTALVQGRTASRGPASLGPASLDPASLDPASPGPSSPTPSFNGGQHAGFGRSILGTLASLKSSAAAAFADGDPTARDAPEDENRGGWKEEDPSLRREFSQSSSCEGYFKPGRSASPYRTLADCLPSSPDAASAVDEPEWDALDASGNGLIGSSNDDEEAIPSSRATRAMMESVKNEKDDDENDFYVEDGSNESRRRLVERQLSVALSEERKQFQSLSRRLLGLRGSQQGRPGSRGSQERRPVDGRSLSPSGLGENGIQTDNEALRSVSSNILRQENATERYQNGSSSIFGLFGSGSGVASAKLSKGPSSQPAPNNENDDSVSRASSSARSRLSSAPTMWKRSKSKKLWSTWKKNNKDRSGRVESDTNNNWSEIFNMGRIPAPSDGGQCGATSSQMDPPLSPLAVSSCDAFEEVVFYDAKGSARMEPPLSPPPFDVRVASHNAFEDVVPHGNAFEDVVFCDSKDGGRAPGNLFGGGGDDRHGRDSPCMPPASVPTKIGSSHAADSDSDEDKERSSASINIDNDGNWRYDPLDRNGEEEGHAPDDGAKKVNGTSSYGHDPDGFMGPTKGVAESNSFNQAAGSCVTSVKSVEVCCDNHSGVGESVLSNEDILYSIKRNVNEMQSLEKKEEKGLSRIRSFGGSMARRRWSRGRQRTKRMATNSNGAAETNGEETVVFTKDDAESIVSTSSKRSLGSLIRRPRLSILRKSGAKSQKGAPGLGEPSQPPKRKSSMNISNLRHCAGDSVENGGLNAAFEYSDLLLDDPSKTQKQCVVCRQKIPKGESIPHMDFYFCSGGCYRCTSCRRPLSEEEDVSGLQIILNARGSHVRCGECAQSVMGGLSAPRESFSSNEAGESRESIHLGDNSYDESTSRRLMNQVSDVIGSDRLMAAAERIAAKAMVKLSISSDADEDDDRTKENRHLSTLFFMQDEESRPAKCSAVLSAKIVYELDSDAFGNPNYDGYACSINNFAEESFRNDTPRMTSVALPKLESDEIDGTISSELEVDLQWVDDDDNECCSSDGSKGKRIHFERSGPATLSIEQFRSEIIHKGTVMKVLRQTWEHEENDILYKISFVVPFKKIYISWEIVDGDELDLTQCQLEVTVGYDPYWEEEESELEDTSSAPMTNNGGCSSIDILNREEEEAEDYHPDNVVADVSMPETIYVKTVSFDHMSISSATSTSCGVPTPSSTVRSRKSRGLDLDRDENDNFSELLSVASCVDSIIALPSILHVNIEKKERECEVGLSLIEKNGATVVAEVSKSGLFAESKIAEGCEILAINGQCVRGPRGVLGMLKDLNGEVSVIASDGPSPPGTRFVVKKLDSDPHGITFQTIDGLVSAKDLAADGIFSESPISKGDICLSIDGAPALDCYVATCSLGRSRSVVAVLAFSLPRFWRNIVEFVIDEKYNRWWKKDSVCVLLWGTEDCAPITLTFDERTGLCEADGNEDNEVDVCHVNIIIERVMKLLRGSMRAYRKEPKERVRAHTRSLCASMRVKNHSDLYSRVLVKLDEMRENGAMSGENYEVGRHAVKALQSRTVMQSYRKGHDQLQ